MALTTWLTIAVTALLAAGAFFAERRWSVSDRQAWPYVWIFTGVVALIYSIVAVWRHSIFETHAFDLGIFDQAVWHLSHFQAPASTVRDIGNLFGDHFHPIISTLAPFYWIFGSPLVLLIGQALLLASSLPLTFALARKLNIAALPAVVIAFAVASNPGILLAINFDFHEVAFAVPLFLGAALAATARRWHWYWVTIVGLLLTKESVCIYAALLGVTISLRNIRGGWKNLALRHGLLTIIVGLSAFLIITRIVIPALSDNHSYGYWQQYASVGKTPVALAENIIIHPKHTLGVLVDRPEKVVTIKYMLATNGFLPLLSWSTWPLILMTMGERFWSSSIGLWLLQFHYQLMMVVVFSLSTLYVLHDAQRWPRLRGLAGIAAIMMLAGNGYVYTKLQPWKLWNSSTVESRPVANWQKVLSDIPPADSVSAQDAFVPHLSHRETIYLFPTIRQADWIILDPVAPSWPLTPAQVIEWQTKLRQDSSWTLTNSVGTMTVFHRK